MTPKRFHDLATNKLVNSASPEDTEFYAIARDLNFATNDKLARNGRPIGDAAAELAQLAAEARQALEQLKEGWLWQLLIVKPTQKPDGPEVK